MTTLHPYLAFNGNCEEAFNYYKGIFGGEFINLKRYKEMPPIPNRPVTESLSEKIMTMGLPINEHTILFGMDGSQDVPFGKNILLSINADSKDNTTRFFQKLSDGGVVYMPLADTFWGAYFGMCEDKFGIIWMISYGS